MFCIQTIMKAPAEAEKVAQAANTRQPLWLATTVVFPSAGKVYLEASCTNTIHSFIDMM